MEEIKVPSFFTFVRGYFHIEVNIAVGADVVEWRHLASGWADTELHA